MRSSAQRLHSRKGPGPHGPWVWGSQWPLSVCVCVCNPASLSDMFIFNISVCPSVCSLQCKIPLCMLTTHTHTHCCHTYVCVFTCRTGVCVCGWNSVLSHFSRLTLHVASIYCLWERFRVEVFVIYKRVKRGETPELIGTQ